MKDIKKDIRKKPFIDLQGNKQVKESRRSRVIAKLIGARCEVEDVLISSGGCSVLSSQERTHLCILMGAIDNIVRRVEQCSQAEHCS